MRPPQNILVILPNPLGDAILATPALRRLHESLPEAAISVLGSAGPCQALAGTPYLREFFQSPLKNLLASRFDAAILLPNSFRWAWALRQAGIKNLAGYDRDGRGLLLKTAVTPFRLPGRGRDWYPPLSMIEYYHFLIRRYLEKIGQAPADGPDGNRLALYTTDRDRQEIDKLLAKWGIAAGEKFAILVPGGAFGGSKWWPAERFAALGDWLSARGERVVLCCAPNDTERKIGRKIAAAMRQKPFNTADEKISLGGLKELVRRAGLMVANDTGPVHLAAAFGVPLVTLFGPTDPRWTATGYAGEIRLRQDVACGPCQQAQCVRDHACMKAIAIKAVMAAAEEISNIKILNSNQYLNEENGTQKGDQNKKGLLGNFYAPFAEDFTPLRDGTGLVLSKYKKLLEEAGLGSLADIFAYQGGQKLLKPGLGSRERLRIELPESTIYLKRYHSPGSFGLLKRWLLRHSRAGAGLFDFAAALQLAKLGITVPRPIAYGQERGGGGEKRSFVIFEELPGGEALERLLPLPEVEKGYNLLRNRRKLILAAAEMIKKMHGRGFSHRDLYLSHLFLARDAAGAERLCLIDLQRVFQPWLMRGRWQVKDLAQLYYSAQPYFSRAEQLRFLRAYAGVGKLAPFEKTLARKVCRKAAKIARHDLKKKK